LEDKLCREGTKRRIVEDYVKLFQVGIERVQGVHEGILFRVQRGECQGGHPRVTKHSGIMFKERYFKVVEHSERKA
jgi:hypothetical protein